MSLKAAPIPKQTLHGGYLGHAAATNDGKATVICLRTGASEDDQWQPLAQSLGAEFEVVCPDLYGYGHSPRWPGINPLRHDDEVDLFDAYIKLAKGPIHLVGHGYGAAIAFKAALRHGRRVKSLSVYEAELFSTLLRGDALHPACEELICIRRTVVTHMDAGAPTLAAMALTDYWGGTGSWAQLTDAQRHCMTLTMDKVRIEWDTIYTDSVRLERYRELDLPILYMTGANTRPPAQRVAERLASVLPRARFCTLSAMNHLAPVSHPSLVCEPIAAFLREIAATRAAA